MGAGAEAGAGSGAGSGAGHAINRLLGALPPASHRWPSPLAHPPCPVASMSRAAGLGRWLGRVGAAVGRAGGWGGATGSEQTGRQVPWLVGQWACAV